MKSAWNFWFQALLLFVRGKLQQDIGFYLQNGGDIEKNIQRYGANHIGCFDRAHMLPADTDPLC